MDVRLSKRSTIITWIDRRLPVFTFLNRELNEYPAPRNLNYFWNFGSIPGLFEEPSALPVSLRQSVLAPASSGVFGGTR